MMHCGHFDTAQKENHSIVFWRQQWLVGDAPFRLKFALKLKVIHPPSKRAPTSTDFRL